MSPVEASQKRNENKVCRNLYPGYGGKTLTPYFQFLFEKGFTPRWTEEVFTINKII